MFDWHRMFDNFIYDKIDKISVHGGSPLADIEQLLFTIFANDDFDVCMQKLKEYSLKNKKINHL